MKDMIIINGYIMAISKATHHSSCCCYMIDINLTYCKFKVRNNTTALGRIGTG